MGDDWVDEPGDEWGVEKIGGELDPARNTTGDDGGGGGSKDHLKEPLRSPGVVVEEEHIAPGEKAAKRASAVSECKPKCPVGDASHREIHEVLHDDVPGVLCPGESSLDEGETSLHEHHQNGRQYQPDLIDRVCYLADDSF